MSISLLVTIAVSGVLSLGVIGYTYYQREKISCMTGMMVAMTLGMLVGLLSGTILGMLLPGNLFYSTLLGMAFGAVAGIWAGVPISIMAVMDGLLSGIMSGMMGAMLGEMAASEYKDSLIKIFFVLFVGTILILFYMLKQELYREKERSRLQFLESPFIVGTLMILFFLGYSQLGSVDHFISMFSKPLSPDQDSERVIIKAREFAYNPEVIKLHAGKKISFILQNDGKQEHDMEIIGLNSSMVETQHQNHSGMHHGNESQVHLYAKPGEQQEINFIPLNPGTYRMVCTIPGHAEQGMEGIIQVS